jgi:hypothetical protein
MVDSSNIFVLEDFESHINKTYIYNFPIEEVYKAFTDKELLLKICEYKIHILNTLRDTFIEDEGNELTLVIEGKHTIILRIIKVIKSKYYYQIKAKTIQHPLDYIPFTINFELFWDSIKEVTVFNGQINISKSSSQEKAISMFKQARIFPTEEIDEYLKNTVKNLEQDESIIVNVNIDIFWDFILKLENIQMFLNMPNTEVSNEGNNIIKFVDKANKNIIRLIEREKKVEDSAYTLYLESFDSILPMPLQSMQIQLIKVNDESTLIIYKHIILDYIPYNALLSNSGNKQKILKKLKKILENKKEEKKMKKSLK